MFYNIIVTIMYLDLAKGTILIYFWYENASKA